MEMELLYRYMGVEKTPYNNFVVVCMNMGIFSLGYVWNVIAFWVRFIFFLLSHQKKNKIKSSVRIMSFFCVLCYCFTTMSSNRVFIHTKVEICTMEQCFFFVHLLCKNNQKYVVRTICCTTYKRYNYAMYNHNNIHTYSNNPRGDNLMGAMDMWVVMVRWYLV